MEERANNILELYISLHQIMLNDEIKTRVQQRHFDLE